MIHKAGEGEIYYWTDQTVRASEKLLINIFRNELQDNMESDKMAPPRMSKKMPW